MKRNYLEMRDLIKTGDILTCSGTAIYSKLIKWWTKSPITHVGIAVWVRFPDSNIDRLAILEAHMGVGVRLAPLSEILKNDYWPKGGKVFWQRIIDSEIDGNDVAANGLKLWSKSYADLRQFVVMGSYLSKAFRRAYGLPLDTNSDRQHCSEVVTRALIEAGYQHEKIPALTTPADVSVFKCLAKPVELCQCDCFNAESECNPLLC